jgi:hypothetical protein
MKTVKITLSIVVLLAFFGFNETFGQWAADGANIHNTNAGNVGIGGFPAITLLHVQKNMTEPNIRVQNLGGSGGATFQMIDNASGADWKFKATLSGGFKIRDNANGLDVIQVEPNSAANALFINAAGYVGIGTNNPQANLHVVGGDIKINDTYPFLSLNSTYSSGNAGIGFFTSDASNAYVFFDDGDNVLRLNASSSNGYRNDLIIKDDGRVCIGTISAATGYALSVNGKAVCTEVLVEALASWPDYVFSEGYDLMSMDELRESINENNRLPGIPSAAEIEANGILLGDMQTRFMEKLEELTLYTLQQDEQIAELQKRIETLEKANMKKSRRQK